MKDNRYGSYPACNHTGSNHCSNYLSLLLRLGLPTTTSPMQHHRPSSWQLSSGVVKPKPLGMDRGSTSTLIVSLSSSANINEPGVDKGGAMSTLAFDHPEGIAANAVIAGACHCS